jgi:hypothetical protein
MPTAFRLDFRGSARISPCFRRCRHVSGAFQRVYPGAQRFPDNEKGYVGPDRCDPAAVPRRAGAWGSPGRLEPPCSALRHLEVGVTVVLVVLALDVADEAARTEHLHDGHADDAHTGRQRPRERRTAGTCRTTPRASTWAQRCRGHARSGRAPRPRPWRTRTVRCGPPA